jgi:outer membrane lipopolysaccharide assembly protein LptE/RlpB
MHCKIPYYTFFSFLLVFSLSACGFKFSSFNKINSDITPICISSKTKSQFRQRLVKQLQKYKVQVSDVQKPGCFSLALSEETISDDPVFGDATQARTYKIDFSIKLTLKTPTGVTVIDKVFPSSASFIVNPNHAINASDQLNSTKKDLFDGSISKFMFASNSEAVKKQLSTPTSSPE